MDDKIQLFLTKKELAQEYQQTIEVRTKRYLSVKPHQIIPHTHFASVSTEVPKLFRDGHFYGAIALTQAVSEAIVRYMCKCNLFKAEKDYENNIATLSKRKLIDEVLKKKLLDLWNDRHDYHHLNPNIEQDLIKLESLAAEKIKLLNEIESSVFAFKYGSKGELIPQYPKYWPEVDKGQVEVYLRFD